MKQTPKQVAENILATFDNLSHSYPGGLNNIRVMLIKSPTSESLPIYFSMGWCLFKRIREKNSIF